MLRSGLVSIPTLTCEKFPLSHPKSCVLNVAAFRIKASKLDLGTGTRAGLVVVWGCSQHVEWQDGNSRNILKQVSLGAVPVLWARPEDWENWESGMLQECGVRVWNRYCTAGRAGKDCKGLGKISLNSTEVWGGPVQGQELEFLWVPSKAGHSMIV